MFKKLFFLLSVLMIINVNAGGASGTVSRVLMGPQYGNRVYITMKNGRTDPPACATNRGYDFVFDSSTAVGKNMIAAILSVYSSGKNIDIGGMSVCDIASNVESIKWIRPR